MDAVTSDNAAAVSFLGLLHPDGPWAITAIAPNRGAIITQTFGPDTVEALHAFLTQHNGQRNLYYALNPPTRAMNKKAKKKDIRSVVALHVDIDARKGEPIDTELDRIRALAYGVPPKDVPPPTFIIMSGGGYQLLWQLAEPISLDGSEAAAEDAKRYSIELANQYGGDHCENVDRILRLPGTINIPDAKKIKRNKGRARALAKLTDHYPDRVYPISKFKKIAAGTRAVGGGQSGARARHPAAVGDGEEQATLCQPISDLSELDEWGVSDLARVVIEQGCDPDQPNRWPSRSEPVFYVCCELMRREVPDEITLGIITDSRWGISAHVLDQPKSKQYARRQIAKARSAVAGDPPPVGTLDQQIARINRCYFAALAGGKVRWWRENTDHTLEAMDRAAFLFELATVRYRDGDDKPRPTAPVWMSHADRRYYPRGFVLDPNARHDGPAYNMWRGFAVEPAPGDWSLMRAHLEEVLAAGDEASADYILRWTAWSFQNPATPPRVALVFRGGEGVGKGVFGTALVEAFGAHGMRIQNMAHLTGKFNAHLRHLCMLFADEAVVPNSDGEGALKGLITETTIPIEAKGVDVVNAENHLHVVLATNHEWAIPVAADARRFAVFDVADHRARDHDYFDALCEQMLNGGAAAMLHDMLGMDLSGFHPEINRVHTAALGRQQDMSLPAEQMAVHQMLLAGELPCAHDAKRKSGTVFAPTLLLVQAAGLKLKSQTAMGRALRVLAGEGAGSKRRYICEGRDRRQFRGFWLPPLEECRRRWEASLGRSVEWPSDTPTWAVDIAMRNEMDDDEF